MGTLTEEVGELFAERNDDRKSVSFRLGMTYASVDILHRGAAYRSR
jgi:long-subunit fatty acid transport protein